MLLLLIAAVITAVVLARRGLWRPPLLGVVPHGPEAQARTILAERFANGDISGEEFLERASVLNWTPGVDPRPAPRRGKKA